ncbi:MAG: AmpG family muropeptide MFS transporter [Alphaproteobacteria bacterium]|nr:AmpG family muropeptide MFS transporter [Alphaproteobacteria bacterium]
MLVVLLLGFSSGLPLLLTLSTLTAWLATAGITKTAIGLFALVGLPYSLKFLWAPLIDGLALPFLTARLGRRRGWAIVIQIALVVAILAMATTDPAADPLPTAIAALAIAFLSASQDIVIDAYRVEILKEDEQGAGAAATQIGYRIGLLAAGAGALFVAHSFGWTAAFTALAMLMGVGMLTILWADEPSAPEGAAAAARPGFIAWLRDHVVAPLADFFARPGWIVIILFILLYKFGDALAGVMANPFYIEMGFSLAEIASISKLFGLLATLFGIVLGGVAVAKLGLMRALLACGILQMLSNLMFAAQAMVGHDIYFLALTIGLENLSGGMGSAAFVAYLSSLCTVAFTATQYALLSSLAAVGRTFLSASGGWLADNLSWVLFFVATTVAALPGLLLLVWMIRRFPARREG